MPTVTVTKRTRRKYNAPKRPRYKKQGMRPINFGGIKYFKRTLNCSNMAAACFQTGQTGGTIDQEDNGDVSISNTNTFAKSYYSVGLAFRLADLPDATEFTTLFDSYQIKKIKLKITGYNTSSQQGSAPYGFAGILLHTVKDKDDNQVFAASDTGINEMREYSLYKTINMNDTRKSTWTFTFTPRIAMAAYGGSVFTSYAQAKPNQWIDCASADVMHYGWKAIFEMSNPQTAVYKALYKMEATFYIGLKDVR